MRDNKKSSNQDKQEKIINDYFKEILDKDLVRNNELDNPPEVDLEIRPKKDDDIIADEC